MIYIITSGLTCGAVKIGHTNGDPMARLQTLQQGCPEKLYLVAEIPGDVGRERRLHKRFAQYRIHGEWFRWEADTDLEQFVSDCAHYMGFWPEDKASPAIREVVNC